VLSNVVHVGERFQERFRFLESGQENRGKEGSERRGTQSEETVGGRAQLGNDSDVGKCPCDDG